MNLKKVKSLSDEQLRIKVAELCGWNNILYGKGYSPGSENLTHIPSYCTDLNAMHEAEEMCFDENNVNTWMAYGLNLSEVSETSAWDGGRKRLHATARQKAEAFVLTMKGKEK